MTDTDVIIVGAGPVGLVTALGLGQAGINVTVLDKASGVLDDPRGMVYHWAALQGLERLGLLEDAKAAGFTRTPHTAQIFKTGERITIDVAVMADEVKHPYELHLGQDHLASIVINHLDSLSNVTICWNTEVMALDQDAAGVVVRAECCGKPEDRHSSWVIGADGARSVVRHSLDLGFDGMTWQERFVATNCRGDYADHFSTCGYLVDPEYGAVVAKVNRSGVWRHTFSEPIALPENRVPDRLAEYFKSVLPAGFSHEIVQWSSYRMHQRAADCFRVGRVLLAGDAAHATNPTSGFGLVGGLFDAYSLSETLAGVIQDGIHDEVLDRWAEDRRRIFWDYTSPISSQSKRLIFEATDEDIEHLRRVSASPDLQRERYWKGANLASTSFTSGASLREVVGAFG